MSKKESTSTKNSVLGMIGLGTMGRNLLLNMTDHGYAVSGFDVDPNKVILLKKDGKEANVTGFSNLRELVDSLRIPRTIMMLVPAGDIVDSVIQELLPLIEEGDIVIDAGNSHFTDTNRRFEELKNKGIHFFGMGISGGEEGARYGPSMMPGGDKQAYETVKPILEAISAKVKGDPCVTYIGPGASGHFVKMVHNGIEYGMMQLIAETYEILKKGLGLNNEEIHQVFQKWNEGVLQSYLLEITGDIFSYKEPGSDHILLDDIRDVAKAKGTGKWTSQIAMDLGVPIPVLDVAVSMRDLSKYKDLRVQAASIYSQTKTTFFQEENKFSFIEELEEAFNFAMVITYAQGMHLLSKASDDYQYNLKLDQIAEIWRGGCIIRSRFLEIIYEAYRNDGNLEHLLLDETVEPIIIKCLPKLQSVLISAISHGIATPAYSTSLSYFDSLRSENMPANLIQAQRDYFGAHTYERMSTQGVFHTQWDSALKT